MSRKSELIICSTNANNAFDVVRGIRRDFQFLPQIAYMVIDCLTKVTSFLLNRANSNPSLFSSLAFIFQRQGLNPNFHVGHILRISVILLCREGLCGQTVVLQPCTKKVLAGLIQSYRHQILKIFCFDSANDVFSCREFSLNNPKVG